MPVLTAQERQEKLDFLASLDRQVLTKTPVRELRKLASGVISGLHDPDMTKAKLVDTILEVTQETRGRLAQELALETARKEAEALSLYAASKEPSEVAIKEAHKQKYAAITPEGHAKVLLERLHDVVSNDSLDNETKLVTIGASANNFIETITKSREITTCRDIVSDTKKELDKQLNGYADSLYYERLKSGLDALKKGLKASFMPYQRAYKETDKEKVKTRANAQVKVNGKYLLDKARGILQLISEGRNIDHANTALAIATVTGRRLSEVYGLPTEFTYVDDDNVMFKGQLKARHNDLIKETAFKIPVLAPAQQVIKALEYLRTKTDRAGEPVCLEEPEDIKAKNAKPVSRAIKNFGWDTAYKDLTFKSLRDIYALLALERKPDNMLHEAYIGNILGHDPADLTTAIRYQKFQLV